MKTFKMVTAGHETKHGALLSWAPRVTAQLPVTAGRGTGSRLKVFSREWDSEEANSLLSDSLQKSSIRDSRVNERMLCTSRSSLDTPLLDSAPCIHSRLQEIGELKRVFGVISPRVRSQGLSW